MTTLIIHAPYHRSKTGVKSFEKVLADGIGDRYAIGSRDFDRLCPGCKTVLLRKDKDQRRAEGILVRLVERNKASNGLQRYDIYIEGLTEVPYKPERLKRTGINVI